MPRILQRLRRKTKTPVNHHEQTLQTTQPTSSSQVSTSPPDQIAGVLCNNAATTPVSPDRVRISDPVDEQLAQALQALSLQDIGQQSHVEITDSQPENGAESMKEELVDIPTLPTPQISSSPINVCSADILYSGKAVAISPMEVERDIQSSIHGNTNSIQAVAMLTAPSQYDPRQQVHVEPILTLQGGPGGERTYDRFGYIPAAYDSRLLPGENPLYRGYPNPNGLPTLPSFPYSLLRQESGQYQISLN
ncbi:hypothetical protein K440DRAFT_638265 [Wilcoxina mikolae CBS 423.85]|nr:hypothetical protein K440DRAFT_638265 [Wilcoxina mikolae CBS 423.85]